MKVLLVEDNVGIPIRKMLEKWGYDVILAEDGIKAWEILDRETIGFLVSDWNLPGLSGLELVKRLRQNGRFLDLPVLMISGRSEKMDIVAALQAGINNYIVKPFTAAQFREKIRKVFEDHEAHKQLLRQIQRVIESTGRFGRHPSRPYVLLGEGANTLRDLMHPTRKHIAQFLHEFGQAVDAKNSEHGDLGLEYAVMASTNEMIKLIRSNSGREHLRAVIVSVDCKGNIPLLARFIGANPSYKFPVLVICNRFADLSMVHLAELDAYQVEVFERQEVDTAYWKEFIETRVVGEGARQKTPAQIRKVGGHYTTEIGD